MTVLDVGKYMISMMNNNKSMGHDINPLLLKLALTYIVEPFNYLKKKKKKKKKKIPQPKTSDLSEPNNLLKAVMLNKFTSTGALAFLLMMNLAGDHTLLAHVKHFQKTTTLSVVTAQTLCGHS